MTVNENWLDMPLFAFVGFDCIRKTIGLSEHTHKVFELTYISEGECTWLTGKGREIHLYGGWAAIIQPGEPHQGKWKVISPSRLFWAGVDPFHPEACFNTVFTPYEMAHIGNILKTRREYGVESRQNHRRSL